VNPEHLQIVSPNENIAEMLERTYYKERIKELEENIRQLDEKIRRMTDGNT
jgi:polyhydroxyalkanoate synthesis regulator phasin